jgi:hypothetical protein
MLHLQDALRCLLLALAGAMTSGCAEVGPQLDQSADSSRAPARVLRDREAGARLVPELRIPNLPAGNEDPAVVRAAAQARPGAPVVPEDDAGPPLGPPAGRPAPQRALDNADARLRQLCRESTQHYAAIDSYIVRLRRREHVNGRDKPEETLLLKFRKQPFSVYFKWLSKEGAGRELIYVKGRYDDKMQMLLAAGDMPLTPAGKRLALSPDSIVVRTASRHSIYEAGIGSIIERFGRAVESIDRGERSKDTLRYVGLMKRPEFERPCEAVEQIIPPGVDALLPRGGRRLNLFDTVNRFPALVITQDDTGREVEYYCFDRFQFPVRLDEDDFNPDKMWAAQNVPQLATPPKTADKPSPDRSSQLPPYSK